MCSNLSSKLRKDVLSHREQDLRDKRAASEVSVQMRDVAYIVNSAEQNIKSLQETVQRQARELSEKTEKIAALQRNYETLSRITQGDRKEVHMLKLQRQQAEEAAKQMQQLKDTESQRVHNLEDQLAQKDELSQQLARSQESLQQMSEENQKMSQVDSSADSLGKVVCL